jgi:hypothetical protein
METLGPQIKSKRSNVSIMLNILVNTIDAMIHSK